MPDTALGTDAVRIVEIPPAPHLREFVRSYHYTELHLGAAQLFKPMTARPEQMLQFSLRRPFTVIDHETGAGADAPDVVLVGRQTRRNIDLAATGEVATFTVHFQPTGFYRLFHMPLAHVTDLSPDAVDVLGRGISDVHGRVLESDAVDGMVRQVEAFLERRVEDSRPRHPVQVAAASLLDRHEPAGLPTLAAQSLISVRQLERAFLDQVGVSPKRFSRIIRFAATLQSKVDHPGRTWAEVVAATGYFDQTHFIHDCRVFGNDTPTGLMETWMDCRP